jgi:uroporphyrinogen decarboxylase
MTTSRERVVRTLNHLPVDRAPRDLWVQPGLERTRGDELAELLYRYPPDIERADFRYPRGERAQGKPGEVGQHTDAWGCTWQVTEAGVPGEVVGHPVAHASDIANYRPPMEKSDAERMAKVNQACAASHRFVLGWSETRPFDRVQFLRGRSAALTDLSHGTKSIRSLLAMVHDVARKDLQMWADSDVDGVVIRDDWGLPQALRLGPPIFRELFRPLYREYCELLHAKDKFVFFHCAGSAGDLFRDLVQIGIDAIHCEFFAMDLAQLAAEFRGRVTFWGEIDSQYLAPGVKPEATRSAVRRMRDALDFGRGGLVSQCQWNQQTPFSNVAAVFDAWLQPLPMRRELV